MKEKRNKKRKRTKENNPKRTVNKKRRSEKVRRKRKEVSNRESGNFKRRYRQDSQRIEALSLYGSRWALSEDSGFKSYPSRPEVY